ncbi:hypothetical protein ACLB2K_039241 [Fragaria x ananassa]
MNSLWFVSNNRTGSRQSYYDSVEPVGFGDEPGGSGDESDGDACGGRQGPCSLCDNITLYAGKYEEEFEIYLINFMRDVKNLIKSISQVLNFDVVLGCVELAVATFKFLTVVSQGVSHYVFGGEALIGEVFYDILIPNVRLGVADKESFDTNYKEFIWRDLEGSDLNTNRTISCELLKGIATHYKPQIQDLVTSFATNPSGNWKDKDCAIYLILSFATKMAGGSTLTTDLVDVQNFCETVIVPELQSDDFNACPMLKASALKFLTKFMLHIPKPITLQVFPGLIRFPHAESIVVQSYAAICIEKLLLVKDEGGKSRHASVDISELLPELLTNLYQALMKPGSDENQYVMKCIMRVLGVAGALGPYVIWLTSIVNKAHGNLTNPVFKNYFFESVAVLMKRASGRDASLISMFANFIPSDLNIVVEDMYALQLLALRVELSDTQIPVRYMQVFEMLLSPDLWRKASKVPFLACLLQAFLWKAPKELQKKDRLTNVLKISFELISACKTEQHVNGIQADLFLMVLQQFWMPVLITGVAEKKLAAVASIRVLCESQLLLDEHWGRLLGSILTLLSQPKQDRVETDLEMSECAESVGYSATYLKLHNAGKTEDDSLKEIKDAEEFLVTSLATLLKVSPDRYLQIIHQYVEETNQAYWLKRKIANPGTMRSNRKQAEVSGLSRMKECLSFTVSLRGFLAMSRPSLWVRLRG